MPILGIGVDLVHVPRIVSLINRRGSGRLASRILSQEELARWKEIPSNDEPRSVRFLAVRWAVKEAAYKALYPTCRPSWKDLTYRSLLESRDPDKPKLLYTPPRRDEFFKEGTLHVSVSHDGEYVFTTVLVDVPEKSRD